MLSRKGTSMLKKVRLRVFVLFFFGLFVPADGSLIRDIQHCGRAML